jgi:hypothetical protein
MKSAAVGVVLAVLAGALAFGLGSQTPLASVYLAPGLFLAGWLSLLMPTIAYWGNPEGGPQNFVFLALLCAAMLWSGLFGGAYYMSTKRRRHPTARL